MAYRWSSLRLRMLRWRTRPSQQERWPGYTLEEPAHLRYQSNVWHDCRETRIQRVLDDGRER